ncbi:MAG: MotA/TolQ/ExbB proton channel family protein [Flavobacteriales bacterium]
MKKLTAFLLLLTMFLSPAVALAEGSDSSSAQPAVEAVAEAPTETVADSTANSEVAVATTEKGFREILKDKFIEGDYVWMSPILICLIIGLAVAIERIIYLNMATINTKKFLTDLESALKSGGAKAAMTVCQNTPGPVAGIFAEGLNRADEGIDVVEKAVVSYGGVEMGKMERALPWLSLFISLAPMLGFLGTVIGMIGAFDRIEAAGDISPTVVAGGIKVALLTTVGGLIVAIILQIFYNYIMSKIEGLVNEMEEASVNFIDLLVKNDVAKSKND